MKLRQFMEGQRKNRKSLSQTHRMNMWKQCHGRCWYCGCDTPKTCFILEHVQPFSRGGADSKRNLVVSCWQCDREKGAKTLEEFRAKRNGMTFYGELCHPLDANQMVSKRTPEERQARREKKMGDREHWRQLTNPRMVRMAQAFDEVNVRLPKKRRRPVDMSQYANAPTSVYALMIAERGKYVREPYVFN